jgi:hypothetical protein
MSDTRQLPQISRYPAYVRITDLSIERATEIATVKNGMFDVECLEAAVPSHLGPTSPDSSNST